MELRISGNLRNGEGPESGNAETERDRETDPISEGLSPLRRHGGHGPEGKPFSHLGRRSRKKKKEGGSLPLASGGTGVPPGPSSCDGDLHQHLRHLHQHLHHLPPSIYSGPLSRNPLYPLLEHGALCFILLSNDVLPSYDVWVDYRCPIGDWWIAMIDLNCLWLCCCPLVPIIWARAWITP